MPGLNNYHIADRNAIVTGASSGIGKRIAERFAAAGANVAICSRTQSDVDEVAAGINDRDGGRAIAVECDVRDRSMVESFIHTANDEFGTIDTLVNNAGASFMAPFEQISPNGWDAVVGANLYGTYHCSQVAGELMREQHGGAIVNIASYAGIRGSPDMSHYGAANAAIINFTTTLAYEWAKHNIRVNCIAPGFVATPGVASQMGVRAADIDREEVARRIGTTDEIADIAHFLVSSASSYLVGETLSPKGVPPIDREEDLVNPPYKED